jgi:hypothetical protein
MLLRYLYTISKLFALILNFVFFDIGVFCRIQSGASLWAAYSVLDTDCCVHIAAHAPPGPPSAAAAEAALGGAAAPAAPAAAPAAAAGAGLGRRSGGRSRWSGHQRNAGARDSWKQELTGAKFAAAGAAAAAAGAGINGTQEHVSVILGDTKMTGAKFGMMIWT